MNSLVTSLYAAGLFNPFESVLALVVFAMSAAVLGAGVWVALRMQREDTGL